MTLDEIYDLIPKIECKRLCKDACGPIPMIPVEYDRLPIKVPLELQTDDVVVLKTNSRLECPMLKGTSCTAYSVRPLICRLFGAVEAMRCPHGCEPERMLSDIEARMLMDEIKNIDKELTNGCRNNRSSS